MLQYTVILVLLATIGASCIRQIRTGTMRSGFFAMAFKPIRDMFVFSGRSRGTEVVAFWFVGMIANSIPVQLADDDNFTRGIKLGWALLWTIPWFALFGRRLHDQGRSARTAWVLVAMAAALCASAALLPQSPESGYSVNLFQWTFHPTGPLAIAHGVFCTLVILAILGFYLAPGQPGPNCYGPDPRLDPGETPRAEPAAS